MGGFSGVTQEALSGLRSYTRPWGFRGIVQEYSDGVRFIRVTDFKGVPLINVSVTVHNTGGDVITMTNQAGIAEIVPDVATPLLIDLKQYSMELTGVAYNTTTAATITTIILDTIIPHL